MKFALFSDTHLGHGYNSYKTFRKFIDRLSKDCEVRGVSGIIIAGDVASSKQREVVNTFDIMRNGLRSDLPIFFVRGNHDFWDAPDPKMEITTPRSLGELNKLHEELFDQYDITQLTPEKCHTFVTDLSQKIGLVGWDGWYKSVTPPTNDHKFMPRFEGGISVTEYLTRKSYKDVSQILNLDLSQNHKNIVVTHFNLIGSENPIFSEMSGDVSVLSHLTNKFDVICYGHDHRYRWEKRDGCHILNSGSDYGNPNYIIFEV